jgi:hypothetical protein
MERFDRSGMHNRRGAATIGLIFGGFLVTFTSYAMGRVAGLMPHAAQLALVALPVALLVFALLKWRYYRETGEKTKVARDAGEVLPVDMASERLYGSLGALTYDGRERELVQKRRLNRYSRRIYSRADGFTLAGTKAI